MRVIAGSLRGRRLKTPTWDGVRPTSDKLRETLFNILAPRIPGARVIDACAGTGAVGIEALSRGALHVTFIEQDRRAQALIAENLAHCGVATGYTIARVEVRRGLEALRKNAAHDNAVYDLVLFDPPYAHDRGEIEQVLVSAGALLAPDGLLVFEHARRMSAPDIVSGLMRIRDVMSGDSALSFYERGEPSSSGQE
jgi:16S rRNA (guanine966-N2)-methyltransferase